MTSVAISSERSGETQPAINPPSAIETTELTRKFGRRVAVNQLNLQVPRGSVYGFLGLNGAGKSTAMRMMMGLLTPSSGQVRVLGLNPIRDDINLKTQVGYVPDTPTFYEWMTVEETFAFVAHYRKKAWDTAHVQELANLFDIPLTQRTGTLSKGQRAKVALILAMGFHPQLLILDEPTLGLDPVARRQFIEGLLAEYMDDGHTVFISSHLINEISGIVDHVGILKDGHLLRSQPAEDLRKEVKRMRLLFDHDPPSRLPELPGLLRSETSGRELQLVFSHYRPAALDLLKPLNATQTSVEDLPLEEAFIELTGPGATQQ